MKIQHSQFLWVFSQNNYFKPKNKQTLHTKQISLQHTVFESLGQVGV